MSKLNDLISRLSRARSGVPDKGPKSGVGPSGAAGAKGIPAQIGFSFAASDKLIGIGNDERLHRAIRAFAPSQPILDISEFAGRHGLLQQLVTAIEEHRNHLVIYGGRGTGKTSIAMALSSVARRAGYHCAYTSCNRDSSLDTIFRSALSTLSVRYDEYFNPRSEEANPSATFADLLPDVLTAQGLIDVLGRIRGTRLLVVIDEFDRNERVGLTRDLTEIMKVLSDLAINCQIVIVGVGNVADSLVGEHASVARALFPARITAMDGNEIRDTIRVASSNAGVTFLPEVVEAIAALASGRPFIARLIGLKAAKIALLHNTSKVGMEDLDAGVAELFAYLVSAGFGEVERLALASNVSLLVFSAILASKRDATDRFLAANVSEALSPFSIQHDMTGPIRNLLGLMAAPECGVLIAEEIDGETFYRFSDPRAEILVSLICWKGRRSAMAPGAK